MSIFYMNQQMCPHVASARWMVVLSPVTSLNGGKLIHVITQYATLRVGKLVCITECTRYKDNEPLCSGREEKPVYS